MIDLDFEKHLNKNIDIIINDSIEEIVDSTISIKLEKVNKDKIVKLLDLIKDIRISSSNLETELNEFIQNKLNEVQYILFKIYNKLTN